MGTMHWSGSEGRRETGDVQCYNEEAVLWERSVPVSREAYSV